MKFTPKDIVSNQLSFVIPIYQRLFEWNEKNVEMLLEDLIKEYRQTNGNGDYYIGMLTSTKNKELIDGQQRFTVMMLIGCVLQKYYDKWKDFLMCKDQVRLYFLSRPSDNNYMDSIISQTDEETQKNKNLKMQLGLNKIRAFIDRIEHDIEKSNFAKYVYEHLSFFITYLPVGYSPRDLNKYFERMNTTGKNLEQHEILKVKLLRNLDGIVDKLMVLWNKLSDVDNLLIRKRSEEKEDDLTKRKNSALTSNIERAIANNWINGFDNEAEEDSEMISSIKPSAIAPKQKGGHNIDSHCVLSFPELLLHTLYRFIKGKINCSISDFFRTSCLLETFETYLPYNGTNVNKENIQAFMEMLYKCRLALDICFIRTTDYGYSLDMNLPEDNSDLKKLLMFQSMLYVSNSSTNYKWFKWLLDAIDECHGNISPNTIYTHLKNNDNGSNTLPSYDQLNYGGEIRYWFWRLDFYIWEHREDFFEKGSSELAIAENYIFRRNRSIEHIAPKTPKNNSTFIWNDTEEDRRIMNCFGNLVMISDGLNSSLSNESYEVKKAHVQSFCNGSKSGTIESLKLLFAHMDYANEWTRKSIDEHGEKMYDFLKESYSET